MLFNPPVFGLAGMNTEVLEAIRAFAKKVLLCFPTFSILFGESLETIKHQKAFETLNLS
jgi:hypothetical protein